MQPQEIYSYLSRVMYNRRSKFDPLWNSLVVGGVNMTGESFLVSVPECWLLMGPSIGVSTCNVPQPVRLKV